MAITDPKKYYEAIVRRDMLNPQWDADALGLGDYLRHAKAAMRPSLEHDTFRLDAIRMRMRWPNVFGPFQVFTTHYLKKTEKVIVFLIHKDEPVVLTDEAGLFPSDTLITQLRLLA